MVAAYNNQAAYVFDMETAKPIVKFEYTPDTGKCRCSAVDIIKR